MLVVTQTACERLSEMLAPHPDDVAIRIVRRKGRMKLRRSTQKHGDEVFGHEGRTVLLLDEDVSAHLEHRTLDVRDSEDGPRLKLRRIRDKREV
jgi:hypothetical protein